MPGKKRVAGVFRFLSWTEKIEQVLTHFVVAGLVLLVVGQVVLHRDTTALFNYGDWMADNTAADRTPGIIPVMTAGSPARDGQVSPGGTITLEIQDGPYRPHIEVFVNGESTGTFRNSRLMTLAVRNGDQIRIQTFVATDPVQVRVVAHSSGFISPQAGALYQVKRGQPAVWTARMR